MDGFPAPPPVPDETKEAWKKTAFLVSQVGSRLDSAHRIRKTSETKVYPNTARGRQQLEEDLLKLPVSYIGGGWWSLYVKSVFCPSVSIPLLLLFMYFTRLNTFA